MDEFIQDGLEKNAIHKHFRTKKEMQKAMMGDNNPYNTFSFRKRPPKTIPLNK
jgi:hypothetical protein